MEKHYTFPLLECFGFSQDRLYSSSHGGIDMSWWYDPFAPLVAVKSGTIVWSGWRDAGGNIIALEMPYSNTQKQWVLYQHCKDIVPYPKKVKQGDLIGNMGNTGHSGGNHLHFTMCKPVDNDKAFDYQYAVDHTINPYDHILFKLKGINYKLNDKPWAGGDGSKDLKKIVEFTNDSKEEDVFSLLDELTQQLKEMNKTIQKIEEVL